MTLYVTQSCCQCGGKAQQQYSDIWRERGEKKRHRKPSGDVFEQFVVVHDM